MATPPAHMLKSVHIDDVYLLHKPSYPWNPEDVFQPELRDHNDVYEVSKYFQWGASNKVGAGYKLKEMNCCPDFDW